MDVDTVWHHIHEQRRALASIVASLAPEDWAHDSLCPGWTVRDVAAHVIAHPQYRWRDFPGIVWRGRFDMKRAIFVAGLRAGQAGPEDILEQYERYDGSRAKAPTTTPLEPLIDVLVHTQDIVRPLGLAHEMPVDAAAVAADRALQQPRIFGRFDLATRRLVATDVDWTRGSGRAIEAPIAELLMLCSGRAAAADLVTGDGRNLVPLV